MQRVLAPAGTTVAIEDPVYHGQRNVFRRSEIRLAPVPVLEHGLDIEQLARVFAQARPNLAVFTPNFQNPTGSTLPIAARETVVRLAAEFQVTTIENDIYGGLRYVGEDLPTLKQLGGTVLVRSFSKVAFPGLRVGWIIAPKALIASLTEAPAMVRPPHRSVVASCVTPLCRIRPPGRTFGAYTKVRPRTFGSRVIGL